MSEIDYIKRFRELYHSSPFKDVWSYNVQNCPYGDYMFNCKDCYLSFELGGSQNCLLMDNSMKCQDCAECSYCKYCQLCSNSLHLEESYNCHFCNYSNSCSDCYYSSNLFNCQHCIGCYALKHKKYYILNQEYSEKEYKQKKKELLKNPKKLEEELLKLKNKIGCRANYLRSSQDCYGDYMIDSHNCYNCFDVNNAHDSAYIYDCIYKSPMQDCFDLDNGGGCELCSNCYSIGYCYNSQFCNFSTKLVDCSWCARCRSCENCFMCVYLKGKKFHILNQEYSEEDYYKKVVEMKKYLAENRVVDLYALVKEVK